MAEQAINLLPGNKFELSVAKLPQVNFFCTQVNLPGVSLSSIEVPTRFVKNPVAGNKTDFNELIVTFRVDENLENYQEVFRWITGLSFPDQHSQYENVWNEGRNSDIKLMINTAANNPNIEASFQSAFPISIGDLNFNVNNSSVEYLEATATFRYLQYSFAAVN